MEYKEKRMKNNVAVKKSRDKSKAKAREAQTRVQQLQVENDHLQNTVDNMTSELRYLKDILISQAGTAEYLSPDTAADLEEVMQEDGPRDLKKLTNVLNEIKRIQLMSQQQPSLPPEHAVNLQHHQQQAYQHHSAYQSHDNNSSNSYDQGFNSMNYL